MSRGSIPRFDLYEELEISRLASVEVVEAAYRALVKRHHPDVSKPSDAERIKRLNVAREWLVSPTRRERYDAATADPGDRLGPTARSEPKPSRRAAPGAATGAAPGAPSGPARPARASTPASFGPNSRDVRQFLALLRAIDGPRARELVTGKATLSPAAYTQARGAAIAASRAGRNAEWAFAREAASVIAKGKLAHSPLVSEVALIVADICGAIVVRDLLSSRDFDLLLAPWTWVDAPVVEPPAAAARSRDLAAVSAHAAQGLAAGPRHAAQALAAVKAPGLATVRDAATRARRSPGALRVLGAVLLGGMAIALLSPGTPDRLEGGVAALTDRPGSPRPSSAVAAAGSATAPASMPAGTASLTPAISPAASAAVPGPGARSPAPSTPRPPATPRPTVLPAPTPTLPGPTPTPSPIPTPVITPAPTPSPQGICTVINLIGVNSSNAQVAWNEAGFTGAVLFSPSTPPHYKIGSQSLAPGDPAPCASDISVQPAAPSS